ncbi:MAG: LysR family transcriptional regulator, partial [Roseobacter sp.]
MFDLLWINRYGPMNLTGIDTFYSLYLHTMQQYPDLDTIEAFVALADAGSFALAGQRVGRDPTIISRRVQALEARLGVRLAERSTRRVTLTEAGRAYLERLRPLLRELAAADREASAFAEGAPRGNLRLSLPTSFGRMWLSPLIAEFLKAHPQVTIEAELSNRFVDIIGEQFDLAVRLGVLPDSRLVARRLFPRYRLLCASPDYL